MPRLIKPTNDAQRLTLLQRALETGQQDAAAGRNYLEPRTVARLRNFTERFADSVFTLANAEAAHSAARNAVNEALVPLRVEVQSLRYALRSQFQHQRIGSEVLVQYGLPIYGRLPQPKRPEEWLNLAQRLLQGDAQMTAAGLNGATNRTQLEGAATAVQTALDQLHAAAATLHAARATCLTQRREADQLTGDLLRELRYRLHARPAGLRRQILRNYGVYFRPLPGEAPETEAANTVSSSDFAI